MTRPERHAVSRPPEHVVHPVDPLSKEGLVLGRVAEKFKSDFESIFRDTIASRDNLLRLTGVARDYSFDLNRFWVYARDSALNHYSLDKRTDKPWLENIDRSLQETDTKLEDQLAKWEEVTSPFSDRYDLEKIYETAHNLRRTIEGGLERIKLEAMSDRTNPVQQAKERYSFQMATALAGVAEQINSRLGALAAGKTVELVTMSRQTEQLLARTGKDATGEKIAAEFREAEQSQNDFPKNDYSEGGLRELWTQRLETALELRRTDLSPQKRRELQDKHTAVIKALDLFKTALGRIDMPNTERANIKDAEAEADSAYRTLTKEVSIAPDGVVRQKYRDWVETLIGREKRFATSAAKAVAEWAQNVQERRDGYQQLIDAARTAAGKDPAGYWRKVKGDFLDQLEAVSGKEFKKTLDDAFDAGLSDILNKWRDESRKTRLDPAKLQEMSADLAATIASYSERTEIALRKEIGPTTDADTAKALQEAGDGVQAGLSALRDAMATKLKALFDNGAFN